MQIIGCIFYNTFRLNPSVLKTLVPYSTLQKRYIIQHIDVLSYNNIKYLWRDLYFHTN